MPNPNRGLQEQTRLLKARWVKEKLSYSPLGPKAFHRAEERLYPTVESRVPPVPLITTLAQLPRAKTALPSPQLGNEVEPSPFHE